MKDEEVLELAIAAAQHFYYGGEPSGFPIISDAQYDYLEQRLKAINPNNWLLQLPGSTSNLERVLEKLK